MPYVNPAMKEHTLSIDKSAIIHNVCEALLVNDTETARQIVQHDYPFVKPSAVSRTYTKVESARIFVRDGFTDRYSGQRLVFPPVLRLLSRALPVEFPYHPNWKMDACHLAYWELVPTIDHIVPIARGGADEPANWVTTSMLRNSAKSNWTLDELGWELLPCGDFTQWDGVVKWFVAYIEQNRTLLKETYVKEWHAAIIRVLKDG